MEVCYLYFKSDLMKHLLFILFFSSFVLGQNLQKPSAVEIQTLPAWAQLMYSEHPSMLEVERLYNLYYSEHPFQMNYHTQYFTRWKRKYGNYVDQNGFIVLPTTEQQKKIDQQYLKKQKKVKSSNWSVVGPITNYQTQGEGSGQANVYSIDQCLASPNVLYCGTEPGEVYKSVNGGDNWTCVSMNEDFGSGVTAVEVDPTQADIVFAGGNKGIFRSLNGGTSWTNVYPSSNLGVNEILVHSSNNQLVFACTDNGFFKSVDGGATWTIVFNQKTYDIKENVTTPTTLYLLKNNPSLGICEFYLSMDAGNNWVLQTQGWYSSSDPARNDGGARLAVSPANPQRIYAYLIGESKTDDFGYIGVFRSDDGGNSWTLPNGPTGGPYDSNHINLAIGSSTWTYHQGFYNCAIMASMTNADEILVGGLNLYRSTDGGATFQSVAGYVGGPVNMHVDMQDFRNFDGVTWITNDGGIYKSTDFFNSDPLFKMSGVNGSEYWGFGSGWNEDVLVGGLYHNGNLAHYENYGEGNFLELGGGEASTGYVNPGANRKTYFSDIGGKEIPVNLNDPILNVPFGLTPNESYYAAESSELVFHPNCYSIAYMGKDNNLWKTTDGGATFNLLFSFGTATSDQIKYIEIASNNPQIMYLNQQPSSGSVGKLWKSSNGGLNWNSVTLPSGNSRRMLLTINPLDDKQLWIAFPDGNNGQKVYKTNNGGQTWENWTSSALNDESIQSLIHIAGTNGGVYVATNRAVYYRNNTSVFQIDNSGLPLFTNGNILHPFYRDGKIRLATYGKGIWQSSLNEQPSRPIARAMVDKMQQTVICEIDSFYFEDYSFLNHLNATWNWTFPTGSPATSTVRNPTIYFGQAGTHLAILKITDANGNTDSDTIQVSVQFFTLPTAIMETFEQTFPPVGWSIENPNNDGQWQQNQSTGGYGNSSKSAFFDNFNTYGIGSTDDLILNINPTEIAQDPNLTFDVAYARWGTANSDTLEILASTDCGQHYQSLYLKGGLTLSTGADTQDAFLPSSSQWRTDSVNLTPFATATNLQIAFRNIGHFGNNLYLDNINIGQLASISETNENTPVIYPNPVKKNETIKIIYDQPFQLKVFDMEGRIVYAGKAEKETTIVLNEAISSGVYTFQIQGKTRIFNKKIILQ